MGLYNIRNGLSGMELFIHIIGVSILLKTITELSRNYFTLFSNKGTYFYSRYIGENKHYFALIHAYGLYARIVLSLFLIAGEYTTYASLMLLILVLIEALIYFKYHVNYYIVLFGSIILADFRGPHFGGMIIIITTVIMYISGALRKIQSGYLDNSNHMRDIFNYLVNKSKKRKYNDFYSGKAVSIILSIFDRIGRLKLNYLVVIIQFILPILLLTPNNTIQIIGIVIGTLFHLLLVVLYSHTLIHFSLISMASYILFYTMI